MKKNKILALILSVLIPLTSMTIPVYASDSKSNEKIVEEKSKKNTELKENLKDGYTVAEAFKFNKNTGTITDYNTDIGGKNVKIPPLINGIKVTSIGENAFTSNKLTSIDIPNSVISIGNGAFSNNQLTSIDIPNSITSIDNWAFADNKLTSINIPDSVTSIGENAFTSNKLTSVNIPNSVTSIGDWAFNNNQLTSVDIPNSITSIGKAVFQLNKLTSVNIPNSVTSIGNYAFNNNQLTSVDIPNNVTSIGDWAFTDNQLTNVGIPDSVTFIGDYAFTSNKLTSLYIPDSVTSVGRYIINCNKKTNVGYEKKDDKYIVDLKKIDSNLDPKKVSNVTRGTYDSNTGIITLNEEPMNGTEITYSYEVSNQYGSSKDNAITLVLGEENIITPFVNVKKMYFSENGLVVDGNLGFEGVSLKNPINTKLVIKDSTGNIVETIDTWKASWGDKNTGFQGIISTDVLAKLNEGEYALFAKTNFDGKDYETKLVTNSNFTVDNTINNSFKILVNANSSSITFEKTTAIKFDSSSEIKQSYWDSNNFVINGVVNIGNKVLSKDNIKNVVIKDSDGNQISKIPTVSVDWFSNKGNFSGFQVIIPASIMEHLTIGTYSLEIQTTYNEVEYSDKIKQNHSLLSNIYNDINDTEEKIFNNLVYKFATDSNNNIVLNIKQNILPDILPAESIANNVYWQNNLNSYFINGGVSINDKVITPDENKHMLILKNSKDEVVSKSTEVVQGWNEEHPYQAQINSNMINNLNPGTYTVYMRVEYNGNIYDAPIKLNKYLTLNTESHKTDRYTVNVGLNSSKDLTITVK